MAITGHTLTLSQAPASQKLRPIAQPGVWSAPPYGPRLCALAAPSYVRPYVLLLVAQRRRVAVRQSWPAAPARDGSRPPATHGAASCGSHESVGPMTDGGRRTHPRFAFYSIAPSSLVAAGALRPLGVPSIGRSRWPAGASVPRVFPRERAESLRGQTRPPASSEPYRPACPCVRARSFSVLA
jgi:hypothetical protein